MYNILYEQKDQEQKIYMQLKFKKT